MKGMMAVMIIIIMRNAIAHLLLHKPLAFRKCCIIICIKEITGTLLGLKSIHIVTERVDPVRREEV